jgi:photosystem II stability/assembly factor-like uncharacterized protein
MILGKCGRASMNSVLMIGTAVTRPGAIGTLYRSANGGDWAAAAGIPLDTGVQALTTHPGQPGTAYAATRAGMYKSTDSGASWKQLAVPSNNEEFWSVSIHPRKPEVVFAGVSSVGVYRSDDGGGSWRRVGSKDPMPELCDYSNAPKGVTSRLMRLCFDPANPDLMFGACETNGLIVSEDGGETWRDSSNGLIALLEKHESLRSAIITPNQTEGILDGHAVVMTPGKPGVVFYACRMGLFSSADQGNTWHNHEVGQFSPFNYCRDLRLAVDDPKAFYMPMSIGARSAAGAFYRSSDLCETWQRADEPVTARSTIMSMNVHATDPKKSIYLTRGGQVMWTEDRCVSWNEKQLPADAGDGFCAAIL